MIFFRLSRPHYLSIFISLLIAVQAPTASAARKIKTDTDPDTNYSAVIRGTDRARITEDDDPDNDDLLEVTGKLKISDIDAGEASFIAATHQGKYGSFVISDAGHWYYAAENSNPLIQSLNNNDSAKDRIAVSSVDGTSHTVTITIKGTDEPVTTDTTTDTTSPTPDNTTPETVTTTNTPAIITGTDTGTVTEDQDSNSDGLLSTSGMLNINDGDPGEAAFVAETVNSNYGKLDINSSGNWFYGVINTLDIIQNLNSNETLTDHAVIRSVDGTTHTVTITIKGVDEEVSSDTASNNTTTDTTDTTTTSPIAMYSYNADLSDPRPLSGATLEQTIAYIFFQDASGFSSMTFYCCKGVGGESTGEQHDAAVKDSSAPFVYPVDLGKYSTSGLRELYVDMMRSDGSGLVNTSVNFSINITSAAVTPAPEPVVSDINLSWTAPAEREDNQPISLSEIAGYKIYYGTSQGDYNNNVNINDGSAVAYTLEGLPEGTYYIVITTVDNDGRESSFSSEIMIQI
jgi:VCBS repeat-containing protein